MSENIHKLVSEGDESKSQALRWLVEMELVSDPYFINAMILNIFKLSNRIKDCQIIVDSPKKGVLIWLELDWFGKKFREKRVKESVENLIREVLPSYRFRIIYDKAIFDKALALLKSIKDGQRAEKKDSKTTKTHR